ncbi:MAG: hypothetical protein EXR31_10475 [Betaproteobacteria bacterium]|nr:hypothetical protein [Betaproteobacteria bacterium]
MAGEPNENGVAVPAKPGDLSDAVKAGARASDIIEGFLGEPEMDAAAVRAQLAAAEAAKRPPFDRAMTACSKRPTIRVNRLEAHEQVAEGWQALHDSNTPAWLFGRGEQIVTVSTGADPDGPPRIKGSDPAQVNGYLIRAARWVRVKKNDEGEEKEIPCEPPRMIAADMVGLPSKALPPLEGVIRAPVFVEGNRLIRSTGYDGGSRLYYSPPRSFVEPAVPATPSDRDVVAAKALLLDRWLGDFPFECQADRTHALALCMLPLVRRTFRGCAPLHVIEAAERGTGKSLLARLLMIPSQNASPEASVLGKEPEETRKKITTLLLAGRQVIFFDNLDGAVDSAELAAVLTSESWEDRLLGSSTPVTAPNRATWIATGNNAELSTDIARRSIRIRLNRRMERPWEWSGAKIADLEGWTMTNRRQLLGAALTLVQSWVVAGAPSSGANLGSFEGWARTIGGIMAHVGCGDFLANLNAMYEQSDSGHREWRSFVGRWWDEHGETPATAGQLASMADDNGLLASVLGSATTDRAKAIRVGKALNRQRDRVLSGLKITAHPNEHQAMYCLEVIDAGLAPPRNLPAPKPVSGWSSPPPHRDSDRW